MKICSSSSFSSCVFLKPHSLTSLTTRINFIYPNNKLQISACSYKQFVNLALHEAKRRTVLLPSPLQENYNTMAAMDGKTELQMLAFETSKIRLLRSLSIENEGMQVLDFAVFARPEFDVPIFCANFFSASDMNIIVLDLNPLHNIIDRKDYKEKYYESLLPLGRKYAELFPWGGKLTSESLQFFSPIVIWTRFSSSQSRHDYLLSAFLDYYKVWLELIEQAAEETDASQIMCNREAQHKYLTWRTEKDPGHGILKKLIGEDLAKDLVRNFLFNGIDELGNKEFLDYFPEYMCENGNVNAKRSVVGKSYENRPWNANGDFIGTNTQF
ncbi:Phytochromobilin:ferredoxin oxidoreductase chloroplastic [Euphorbia peplus]|nr:Phytochromobilin:ferredoxin oxidoreductase chloroplastic [Euphorbia peplus]